MTDDPIKKTPEARAEDARKAVFDGLIAQESAETKSKLLQIAKDLKIRADDPMWLCIVVVSHCRLSVAPLPELIEELKDSTQDFKATVYEELKESIRDFKATAYDVQRESARVAHLLQRNAHGIQLPLSRAMWSMFGAGLVGVIVGVSVAIGFNLFATRYDCTLDTAQCEKLRLKEQ